MSNVATQTYPPSDDMAANAHVNAAKYDAMYHASIADPEGFWLEQAQRIDWMKPFTKVKGRRFHFRSGQDQLVCRRCAERQRQLHRPSS